MKVGYATRRVTLDLLIMEIQSLYSSAAKAGDKTVCRVREGLVNFTDEYSLVAFYKTQCADC